MYEWKWRCETSSNEVINLLSSTLVGRKKYCVPVKKSDKHVEALHRALVFGWVRVTDKKITVNRFSVLA